ncbi:MAG: TonB-dependent receptor [Deltaproteobacteria bacterium]|nr:TonB-dependent receptor [Deltaproteobacteria bacterium]
MKRIYTYYFGVIICVSFLALFLHPRAAPAETCEKWVAKVVSAQGTVEVRRAGEVQWEPVELNGTYCPGDTIRVERRSRAAIALVNQPVLRLDQNSTITLSGLKEEKTSVIDLLSGAAHFFSRVSRNLEVRTAFVNAGVEGTEGLIRVEENETSISIFEGKVLAVNEAGSLAVTSGQTAVAEAGKAPVSRVMVRPRDAVQWALYYPPVIYYSPSDFQGFSETDWRGMMEKSLDSYWKGNISGAFTAIENIPEDLSDSRFFTYRAGLLLTVGRVDEAAKDIEQALVLAPENGDAIALRSIVAVVQNEREKGLDLAQKAVETAPNSAAARIALSYARQARFDLTGALESVEEVVKMAPDNALAWARLAELRLSFGELDDALDAAEKGVDLNPHLSRTQTVLGYAYLTQVKTREARSTFEGAIVLDPADPLSRLGLGLGKIRDGALEEGRREIEIAVALDPDNSLMRSYLGKAYFEEKREKLDGQQFATAKEFDPNDPTPYFYDAIRKQTVNRPVEALRDMERAIELNDNRAVYRSRLLLDADLAARSASLARIYSDLGFRQLALVEGWKSVNTDPSNYSAHRFLADTYSVLPRHEIARVSELLQSQLLQPINITPVQPRLAESNLFAIEGGGPGELSFNEFNPLFLRNRIALQASGIVGESSTWGDEVVVAGLYKRASISVGQYHFEKDGFKVNSDSDDDIYNAFVQFELSHKTSVQAEYRHRELEQGDLQLRFFPDDLLPALRSEEDVDTVRFGFHHAFSPGSDLIGNVSYQTLDEDREDEFFFPPDLIRTDDRIEADAIGVELQYLFASERVKFTTGAGFFDDETEFRFIDNIFDPSVTPPLFIGSFPLPPLDIHTIHKNVYFYSYINYSKNVTFTVGGSVDFFDSGRNDGLPFPKEDQFNPKFGVTWTPFAATTVRGAVFRTLKRLLITDQTLEPTQVAGFNQFFDDFNATETWRYGIAVDQKFSGKVFGGAEFSKRDLDVPFLDFPPPTFVGQLDHSDWKEYFARAYLYYAPHEWLSLTGEYLYEKFEREFPFVEGAEDVKTHRVPLGVSLFHSSGLNVKLKATYFDQEGVFERASVPGLLEPGDDDFWLVDAAVGYRLPKRYGFITVGAKNLFDESFQYFDTDPDNPAIQPERLFFVRLTISI